MKTRDTARFMTLVFEIAFFLFAILTIRFWDKWMKVKDNSFDMSQIYSLLLFFLMTCLISFLYSSAIRIKGIHLTCILWEMVMLVVLFLAHSDWDTYVSCTIWPLLFESTFLLACNYPPILGKLRKIYAILTVVSFVYFIKALAYFDMNMQSNMVFFVLLPFPWLLTVKDKKIAFVLGVIMSLIGIFSMKRSMMITVALFWLIMGVIFYLKSNKKVLVIALSLVVAIVIGIGFVYIDNFYGGRLSERISEDEDTKQGGRSEIYVVTWSMIASSTPFELVMGHGHNAVKNNSPLEVSAHNEFLEIIYDYGLIILFLYLCLWGYVIKRWVFLLKINSRFLMSYTFSIAIFAVMALVSQLVLYASYFLYLVMYWACIDALTKNEYSIYLKEKRVKKEEKNV